jgi:hypothetical protein
MANTSILGLHTNRAYKLNLVLSELTRAMHDRKLIHDMHDKFRNFKNACRFEKIVNLKISYNDENLFEQQRV